MVFMMFTRPLVTAATIIATLAILHVLTLPANAQCPCEGALPALQSLYNATDGSHWINPWQNLFSGVSVCDLSGINCTSNGNIWIELRERNLVGTIPDDFAVRYPRVSMFAVAFNNLRGTLPSTLALFGEHIGFFDVSRNGLGGTLPAEFSNWTMVNNFWIQNCSIKGTLPSAYASWGSNLKTFYFYSNFLSGTIPPEYSAWSSITVFSGSDNMINGTIPRAVISAWKYTIYDFAVSRNGLLTGDLFGSDGNGFCEWIRIFNFIASDNMLSGSIPSCLSNWGTTIDQLSLSNNSLTGTLPSSLQTWTIVRNIEFGTNLFEGTLPAVYSLMKKMEGFNAKNNNLIGTLPPQYGQWSSLLRFYVDGNQLTGTLPDAYDGWGSSVFDIRISQNNLSGTLPASWGVFTNVERLSLSFNQLTGTLPSSYSSMKSLVVLSLDLNQLQGPLPPSWQSLTSLQAVGLQYNYNLQGPIPPSWSSMRRLLVMAVCNTSICGNASMFVLVGAFGFTCPQPSALANLDTAALQQYILASQRYSSFPCINTPAPVPSTPLPSLQPARNNATTAVLPYTALAQSSATAAVWSVVAARGVPISGASPPAASVAFLQGAFASSRLRRRCTALTGGNSVQDASEPPPLSDPLDNPTQVELSSTAGRYAGGAVIGNSALLTGITLIGHGATLLKLWLRRRKAGPGRGAARCALTLLPCDGRFPASGFILFSLLIQPSVAACIVLFVNNSNDAEAIVIAVFGMLVWGVPLAGVTWKLYCMQLPFTTIRKKAETIEHTPTIFKRHHQSSKPSSTRVGIDVTPGQPPPVTVADAQPSSSREGVEPNLLVHQEDDTRVDEDTEARHFSSRWAELRKFFWTPTHSWRTRHLDGSTKASLHVFYDAYGVFFAGVRAEWKMLFAVELGVALISGVVQGAAEAAGTKLGDGAADAAACDAAVWGSATLAALAGTVLFLHVVWKPCLVRFDELQCIVLTAMVVASECANAVGGDAGEQVGELLALTAAITQAVLVVVEVIVTRLFLGAAALHAASPFRYLESVVQSGAAKVANSLPSSAIKNMLNLSTTTILPTRQVVSLTEVLNESQDSHETRRTSQQHQRTFVTLTQMKELKNLLRAIAQQQQTKNQSRRGRER